MMNDDNWKRKLEKQIDGLGEIEGFWLRVFCLVAVLVWLIFFVGLPE